MKKSIKEIEFSIVMPCLNEAKTLGVCIKKAHDFFSNTEIEYEIIVADNGSTDGSQEIANSMGAKLIFVSDKGYGNALRAGIENSDGKYIIMGDSDDSYDFSDLSCFIKRLREGNELVMGNRFAGEIKPGAMPWLHRYIGNPILSLIGRQLFKISIHDFHCGLRGFSKECYNKLHLESDGMEFASEFIVKAAIEKVTCYEIPIILYPDGRDRAPHLRSWSDGYRHLKLLITLFYQNKKKKHSFSKSYLILTSLLILLPLIVKLFVGEVAYVSSKSMMPTLYEGDWIWYNKCSYGAIFPRRILEVPVLNFLCLIPGVVKRDINRDWGYQRMQGINMPQRMDIIIFKEKKKNTQLFIKRIIGMPKDTITIQQGIVFINGTPLTEKGKRIPAYDNFGPIIIDSAHYFVMGDFRNNSLDSRNIGTVSYEQIEGKTTKIIFSGNNHNGTFYHHFFKKAE